MPRRINPIALYLLSLGAMIIAYASYAQFAVPMIEGKPEIIKREIAEPVEQVDRTAELRQGIAWLFPADAWELDECKILLSPQGKILFQDYERLDDGMIDVFPCTLVLNPKKPGLPPTVMRALKGARLKLDKPLTAGMSGGEAGKLEQAQLAGQVAIYRPPSSPEKNDSLQIVTSNVQVDRTHVYTLEEVDFQFGPNRGHGRNLLIELKNESAIAGAGDLSGIAGFKRIELAFLDRLRLEPSNSTAGQFKQQPQRRQIENPANARERVLAGNKSPIDITCAGPFVFDLESNTAVFNTNVKIQQDDSFNDNLTCDRLNLTFEERPSGISAVDDDQLERDGLSRNLQLKRFVAVGAPATLTANSRGSSVTGEVIDYNLANGHFAVSGNSGAALKSPDYSFTAKSLSYVMPDDGSIGPLDAEGPGRMTGKMSAANLNNNNPGRRPFNAAWNQSLTIRPADDGQRLVTMNGDANINLDAETNISSNHLKFWIRESVQLDPVTRQPSADKEYVPVKLFTEGEVRIVSPQLSGTARQLVANWPAINAQRQAIQTPRQQIQAFEEPDFEQQNFNRSVPPVAPAPAIPNTTEQDSGSGTSLDERFRGANYQRNDPQTLVSSRVSTARPPYQTGQASPIPTTTLVPPVSRDNTDLWPNTQTAYTNPVVRYPTTAPVTQTGMNNRQAQTTSSRQFRFDGDKVDVSLGPADLGSPILDLTIDGNVLVNEVQQKSNEPLKISGDKLRLTPQGEMFVMRVTGTQQNKALVDNGQLKLSGPDISFDQPGNRININGPGEMSLIGNAQNNGSQNNAGTKLDVAWQELMSFDGRRIEIQGDVVMSSAEPTEDGGRKQTNSRGHRLEATLKRPVNLQNLENAGQQSAEIDQLVLLNRSQEGFNLASHNDQSSSAPSSVAVYNRTFDSAGNLSEHMEFIVPKASISEGGTTLSAHGPGVIINRSLGESSLSLSMPKSTPGSNGNNQRRNADGITYVQVNFDGPFSADMTENKFRINGNVRTVYSTISNWQQGVDPDATTSLPPGAVKLTCDQIQVDRWQKRDRPQPTSEMRATGNAHITSDTFEATADRVSYEEANDMLVIEGSPRSKANLWYHPPGTSNRSPGNRQKIVAGKILYRPSDQWTHVQGIKSGTLSTDR